MAFYIRKAFKTGPVRLNLSKGGLGLSAGITGARVGINRKGTYVHGGRHGLYYRKYVNRGESGRSKKHNRTGSNGRGETIDLFHNTGVTFSSNGRTADELINTDSVDLPELSILTTPYKISLGVVALLSLGAITDFRIGISALIGWIVFLSMFGYRTYWLLKAKNLLRLTIEESDKSGHIPESLVHTLNTLPEKWKENISLHLHAVIGEMAMRSENIDTKKVLRQLDKYCPADKQKVNKIRASILGNILEKMLKDHLLSADEEHSIRELIDQIGIGKEYIETELQLISHFGKVRDQIQKPLEPIDPGIPLVRGEDAFEKFENVRLLYERVLNRYQRNNIQYRELGYEIDIEGELILTDRRMILIDKGTREYRLNRVMDVTADPEAGIVEIVLSNRKNPLILTAKEPLLLASRIQIILREKVL